MKRYMHLLFILFCLSCNQSDIKQRELDIKEKELALRERELALREKDSNNVKKVNNIISNKNQESQIIIENWLKKACGITYNFSNEELILANFKTYNNYEKPPTKQLIEILSESVFVELIKKGTNKSNLAVSSNSISFSYSYDEPGTGRILFLLENKIYYTQWYVSAAETYEYNLVTLKLKRLDYAIHSIKNGIAKIEKSYYDPRGPENPNYQGHIFIEGKLNIQTGQVKWLKRL